MKESSICQFYHYDEHSLSIYNDTKASVIDKWDSTVFTSEAVNWLNFHSLDDKDIIEKLHQLSLKRVENFKHHIVDEYKVSSSRLLLCTPQIDSSKKAQPRITFNVD